MSQNLRPTQHGIQSCSLHQLKENLLHKNNIDTRIITLSNRGISFRFRLARMRSFFYILRTQSAHFISLVFQFYSQSKSQNTSWVYVCFPNIDCTYRYQNQKMKGRRVYFQHGPYSQANLSQVIFSSLSASEIPASHAFSFSKIHQRNLTTGELDTIY